MSKLNTGSGGLCVGLHAVSASAEAAFEFNRGVIDATHDSVLGYRLSFAAYEALGTPGYDALERTIRYIRSVSPHSFVLGDAMRSDVSLTASAYARAVFETLDCDAATVTATLGSDGLMPFLADKYSDKTLFVLCRTSNPSADQLQLIRGSTDGVQLYETVARLVAGLPSHNTGLIFDSGMMEEAARLKRTYPRLSLMIRFSGREDCFVVS